MSAQSLLLNIHNLHVGVYGVPAQYHLSNICFIILYASIPIITATINIIIVISHGQCPTCTYHYYYLLKHLGYYLLHQYHFHTNTWLMPNIHILLSFTPKTKTTGYSNNCNLNVTTGMMISGKTNVNIMSVNYISAAKPSFCRWQPRLWLRFQGAKTL